MKQKISTIFICLLVLTMFLSMFGCSSSKSAKEDFKQAASTEMNYDSSSLAELNDAVMKNKGIKSDSDSAANRTDSISDTVPAEFYVQSPDRNVIGDMKIIYKAYISIEVEEFDTAYNYIKSIGENSAIGYIQSANSRAVKVSSFPETYRKEGSIVLRIAQNKFYDAVNEISKQGTVLDNRTDTENITDQYYDTKYRLRMYETERERVMEYLKKASDLNTMLQLERKLSEITYEIEKLNGTLRSWDNMVQFATITVDIHEKTAKSNSEAKAASSYGARLLNTFTNSFSATIKALGDFILLIVSLLPTLIILAIVYFSARPLIQKFFGKKKNRNHEQNLS